MREFTCVCVSGYMCRSMYKYVGGYLWGGCTNINLHLGAFFLYKCGCVCTHLHVCGCMLIDVWLCAHRSVWLWTHLCLHVGVCVYTCICADMPAREVGACVYTRACMWPYEHWHMHASMCGHLSVCFDAYVYTNMCLCTCAHQEKHVCMHEAFWEKVCNCMWVHLYRSVSVSIRVWIHVYVDVFAYACSCTCGKYLHTRMGACG